MMVMQSDSPNPSPSPPSPTCPHSHPQPCPTAFPHLPCPQVRAILADVEDRLRDWSPIAFGTKAQLGTDPASGAVGAPSCLCCDSRVRSVRDLRAMGFREEDRVFSPDKVPLQDPLLPSIQVRARGTMRGSSGRREDGFGSGRADPSEG